MKNKSLFDFDDRPTLRKRDYDFRKPRRMAWRLWSKETIAAAMIPAIWLLASQTREGRYDLAKAYVHGRRIDVPIKTGKHESFAGAHLNIENGGQSYVLETVSVKHFSGVKTARMAQSITLSAGTSFILEPDSSAEARKLGPMHSLPVGNDDLEVTNTQGRFIYRHRTPSIIMSLRALKNIFSPGD